MGTKLLGRGIAVCAIGATVSAVQAGPPTSWHKFVQDDTRSVAFMHGNTVEVVAPDGTTLNHSVMVVHETTPFTVKEVWKDTNEWGYPISVSQENTVIIGYLPDAAANAHDPWIVAVVASVTARGTDEKGGQFITQNDAVVPVGDFADIEDALKFIEPVRDPNWGVTAENGEGGIVCMNPSWVGNNGEQCCQFVTDMYADQNDCLDRLWGKIRSCLGSSILKAGGGALLCLKVCKAPPCIKLCLIGAIGYGLYDLWGCLSEAWDKYQICLRQVYNFWRTMFSTSGCGDIEEFWIPEEDY